MKRSCRKTVSGACRALTLALAVLLLLTLCACQGSRYEKAVALEESGAYEAAYDAYEKVPTYKDANGRRQRCAEADIGERLSAGDLDAAFEKLEKYRPWEKTGWYRNMLTYAETAAAGSYAEQIRLDGSLLSCVVHLDAPIEGQYLRITLTAPEDSEIYQGSAYTTAPKEDLSEEDAEQYFDMANYASDGVWVLENVDVAAFKYTLPSSSKIYEPGIFRPETQAMMSALSFLNPYREVVSPGGVKGISFTDSIDYALFNSSESGPVDSVPYAFAGGMLYLEILSPDDEILMRAGVPIPGA